MNEPSPSARRAAEAICDTFTVLARTSGGQTSFDEAEPIDLAAIIERETGVGESRKIIEGFIDYAWKDERPPFAFADKAAEFLQRFSQ